MSILKLLMAQIGKSVTAANNFVLDASANNGTMRWARGNAGATTQDVLLVASDGKVDAPQGAKSAGSDVMRILQIPAKVTTSGTFIDFSPADGSGIPAWAKEITINLTAVSTNGASQVQLQLGTSAGFVTTGYRGSVGAYAAAASAATIDTGAVLDTPSSASAGSVRNGMITFALGLSNAWNFLGLLGHSNGATITNTAGTVPLPGVLDRIRLTTMNGTDSFDVGSASIIVKG